MDKLDYPSNVLCDDITLVCQGCQNKNATDRVVEEQKFTLTVPQAGNPRPGVGSVGSSRGLSSWLADGHLLTVSSHGFSLCTHISDASSSSDKDTSPIGLGSHPYDLS